MMRRVVICLGLLAILSYPSWATEFRTGKTVTIEADEVIKDDLLAAGESVYIAGHVEGDVFAVGKTVRITGPVTGTVLAGGQRVEIAGPVTGSLWSGGQSVSLGSSVGRNSALAGQTVILTQGGNVGRDFHAAGSDIELEGVIGRRATLAGQNAALRGRIGDSLYFEGDSLYLASAAQVAGDLIYRSSEQAQIEPGAKIGGRTEKLPPRPTKARPEKPSSPLGPALIFGLIVFVTGVVGIAANPRVFVSAANAMATRPWWNLLLGVLVLIILPIAAIIAICTIIGIPLGLLALVGWTALLVFSGVPVGIFIGRWLLGWFKKGAASPYLGLIIGLIILIIIGLIPILGTLSKLLTILFGLGGYARAVKGALVELRAHAA